MELNFALYISVIKFIETSISSQVCSAENSFLPNYFLNSFQFGTSNSCYY